MVRIGDLVKCTVDHGKAEVRACPHSSISLEERCGGLFRGSYNSHDMDMARFVVGRGDPHRSFAMAVTEGRPVFIRKAATLTLL
jgi:hypothetical protein